MRWTGIALVATTLLGAATLNVPSAGAQSFEVGPGGVGVDLRTPRQRERDRIREEERRDMERERRRAMRDYDGGPGWRGGPDGCREVTIRERNDYGETVTRTRRDCR